MSISLQDKVEAVYELRRCLDRGHLDDTVRTQLQELVNYTMRENKRMAAHTLNTVMKPFARKHVTTQCPTFTQWVTQ